MNPSAIKQEKREKVLATLSKIGNTWRNDRENLRYAEVIELSELERELAQLLKLMKRVLRDRNE